MATVINTFPDRRGALIGKGIGTFVGNVLEARRKAEDKRVGNVALAAAADLSREIQLGIAGDRDESDLVNLLAKTGLSSDQIADFANKTIAARVAKSNRAEDAQAKLSLETRTAGRLETRRTEDFERDLTKADLVEDRARGLEQRTLEEADRVRGEVVARDFREEQRRNKRQERIAGDKELTRTTERLEDQERGDAKFADSLALAAATVKAKELKVIQDNLAVQDMLKSIAPDTTPMQLLKTIGEAKDIPLATRMEMLKQIGNITAAANPGDEEIIPVDVYSLADGQKGALPAPESIANLTGPNARELKDKYFQDQGYDVTTLPTVQTTGEERLLAQDIKSLGDTDEIKHMVAAQRRGLIKVEIDAEGNQYFTDLSTGARSFLPSAKMGRQQAEQISLRRSAIAEVLPKLRKLDLTQVGLEGWLRAEIGGLASGILAEGFLDWFGLERSEIIKAQLARQGFFNTLIPFAEAIVSEEGERRLITSKTGIDIAKEVLDIFDLSSRPAFAQIAVTRLIKQFEEMDAILKVQLETKTLFRPVIVDTTWEGPSGQIKGTLVGKE